MDFQWFFSHAGHFDLNMRLPSGCEAGTPENIKKGETKMSDTKTEYGCDVSLGISLYDKIRQDMKQAMVMMPTPLYRGPGPDFE